MNNTSAFVGQMLPLKGGLSFVQKVKNLLFFFLLLAGCQAKNEQPSSVTINGKEYTDSVAVDSSGNKVQVKSGTVEVSGSGNKVDIK
ncbi:hypothetical protein [Spirosoma rigui]|uniref:hypothetical protein n=1 Tax=Spirosoma rigui TaxID=564064 RepID=UPI0009B112E3|nr:hypothetical protein [Spirosoma rigui]